MILALAVLFFQAPSIPLTPVVASRVEASMVQSETVSESAAAPEESTKAPLPEPVLSSGPNLTEIQPLLIRWSFRTRNDLARLFGATENGSGSPAPAQPGQVEQQGGAAAPGSNGASAANAPGAKPDTAAAAANPAAFQPKAEVRPNKRLWYALTVAQHTAATFDAWSTRRAVESGHGHEVNPLLRPFAGSNGLYAAIQVGPGLLDYLGRRMMTSQKCWVRRIWWLPQTAGTAGALWGGAHNLGVAGR